MIPFTMVVRSQNIILSFLVTLSAMADSQKRRQVGQGHRGSLAFKQVVHCRRQYHRFAWRVCATAMVVQSL
jgi:hypothetical protein